MNKTNNEIKTTGATGYSSISGPRRNFASKAKELFNKVPEEGPLLQMQYFRHHALELLSDHEVENPIAGKFEKIYSDNDHSPDSPVLHRKQALSPKELSEFFELFKRD